MTHTKNYSYQVDTSITRAMSAYNQIMPGQRFNTLDASILNLIKSFNDSRANFFMSNKELGNIMVADPSTVQRSVDRLLAAGLISKKITHVRAKPQRILTYQSEAVNGLLALE